MPARHLVGRSSRPLATEAPDPVQARDWLMTVRGAAYLRTMIIDCHSCQAAGPACGDCLVTVLLGNPQVGTHEVAAEHETAVGVLAACGLVPPLRLIQGGSAVSGRAQAS